MDIDNLYYIGRKIIQRKYPWIDDLIFTHRYDDDTEDHLWSLEIFANKDFKEQEVFLDKHEVEIETEMKSLFNMIGPKDYEKFDRVTIF